MQDMANFYLLKEKLLLRYRDDFPYWQHTIHDFKGREISNFQKLLELHVGGRVSEKWFYTHIKPKVNTRLPRIDTLDMLSAFVGYQNWDDFVFQNQQKEVKKEAEIIPESTSQKTKKSSPTKVNQWVKLVLPILILGIGISLASMLGSSKKTHQFCFIDADKGTEIDAPIEVTILNETESPEIKFTDDNACITFEDHKGAIQFIVSAPYYQKDTIKRILPKSKNKEIIKLKTDDYALMIHLFSDGNYEAWQKRRAQLNNMLSDDVIVYEIASNKIGIAMYNKTEFIDKLTMPINSLKNIRILETKYAQDQIIEMRFIQDKNN